MSQLVMYTVNVVKSQKRARQRHCYYRPLIGSDIWLIESRQFLFYCTLFKRDFSYGCAAVNKISTDNASRGPSAKDELLVVMSL